MSFPADARSLAAAALASLLALSPAAAQDQSPRFALELNAAAETETGSCLLTYVAANQSDIALSATSYDVAVFDAEGVVNRLLVLEFGALIAGKTKILQFELAQTPCTAISRLLINDVAACTRADDGSETDLCLAGLTASSRTAIQFGL